MESLITNLIELITAEMPQISLVDEDYGQLENLDVENPDMYPITFPCVLIDAPQTQWSSMQGNSQKGTTTVNVRLCIDCYDDTHGTSPTIDKVHERMEMVRELHKALQGHRVDMDGQGDDIADGVLVRTSSTFRTSNHGIKVYEMTYTTTVTEIIDETMKVPAPSVHVHAVRL